MRRVILPPLVFRGQTRQAEAAVDLLRLARAGRDEELEADCQLMGLCYVGVGLGRSGIHDPGVQMLEVADPVVGFVEHGRLRQEVLVLHDFEMVLRNEGKC